MRADGLGHRADRGAGGLSRTGGRAAKAAGSRRRRCGMGELTLRIVTPKGLTVDEHGLDEIVVRRREEGDRPGSEIAVFRRHGPTLIRTADCVVRFRRGGRVGRVRVEKGVTEVLGEIVTMLVPGAERV